MSSRLEEANRRFERTYRCIFCLPIYPSIYLAMAPHSFCWTLNIFFQFLNPTHRRWYSLTGRSQSVTRPLPTRRTTQTQNKRTQTSKFWVGCEPTIQCSGVRRRFMLCTARPLRSGRSVFRVILVSQARKKQGLHRNVSKLLRVYTMSYLRQQHSPYSRPWKPQYLAQNSN
jgi:hypothetical protein